MLRKDARAGPLAGCRVGFLRTAPGAPDPAAWTLRTSRSRRTDPLHPDGRHDPAVLERPLSGRRLPRVRRGRHSHRLGVDRDDATRGTLLSDAHAMLSAYSRLGMTPANHRD